MSDRKSDSKKVDEKKEKISPEKEIDIITDKLQKVSISSKKYENLNDIIEFMRLDECRNIIVLAGAGISTSCGIPDFRSPGSGIYDNLVSYNLPYPEALFEIDYFVEHPEPFYKFCKKNLDCFSNAKPSITHYFIKLLEDKGKLRRVFTQNIDGLELNTGISEKVVCQAHGSLKFSKCMECEDQTCTIDYQDDIINEKIPHCKKCNGLIKPNIVLFGEDLPNDFHENLINDVSECDLLIVMGTSLQVQPISSIVDMVGMNVPKLLINLEAGSWVSKMLQKAKKFLFLGNSDNPYNSYVYHRSTCDDGCLKIAKLLGWEEDLLQMVNPQV